VYNNPFLFILFMQLLTITWRHPLANCIFDISER